jgi:hypothetical protein
LPASCSAAAASLRCAASPRLISYQTCPAAASAKCQWPPPPSSTSSSSTSRHFARSHAKSSLPLVSSPSFEPPPLTSRSTSPASPARSSQRPFPSAISKNGGSESGTARSFAKTPTEGPASCAALSSPWQKSATCAVRAAKGATPHKRLLRDGTARADEPLHPLLRHHLATACVGGELKQLRPAALRRGRGGGNLSRSLLWRCSAATMNQGTISV